MPRSNYSSSECRASGWRSYQMRDKLQDKRKIRHRMHCTCRRDNTAFMPRRSCHTRDSQEPPIQASIATTSWPRCTLQYNNLYMQLAIALKNKKPMPMSCGLTGLDPEQNYNSTMQTKQECWARCGRVLTRNVLRHRRQQSNLTDALAHKKAEDAHHYNLIEQRTGL